MNTQAQKKTKREEAIDKKIEKLLENYKRKDEQASNKVYVGGVGNCFSSSEHEKLLRGCL